MDNQIAPSALDALRQTEAEVLLFQDARAARWFHSILLQELPDVALPIQQQILLTRCRLVAQTPKGWIVRNRGLHFAKALGWPVVENKALIGQRRFEAVARRAENFEPDMGPIGSLAVEALREELKAFLASSLSRKERLFITLHYYENLTLSEVGQVFSLTEAESLSLHRSILTRLREKFRSLSKLPSGMTKGDVAL